LYSIGLLAVIGGGPVFLSTLSSCRPFCNFWKISGTESRRLVKDGAVYDDLKGVPGHALQLVRGPRRPSASRWEPEINQFEPLSATMSAYFLSAVKITRAVPVNPEMS
jgi:hypothetical protein